MQFSATEALALSSIAQVGDGVSAPSYKWFLLQGNKLDGTFHPFGNGYQTGWIGIALSSSTAVFSTPPAITTTFFPDSAKWGVDRIAVTGDSLLGEYPVDFTVDLLDGSTVLYTHTVTANTQVNYTSTLSQAYKCTSMKLTITKWSLANRSAKILEAVALNNVLSSSTTVILRNVLETQSVASMSIVATDSIAVSRNLEVDVIQATLPRTDSVKVKLSEASSIDSLYTASNSYLRQVFGKVEITYTDPFLDESIQFTVSELGRYTYASELSDNLVTSQYKWFSLHNNKLDGSFHSLPVDSSEGSVGWWGTQLSQANGVLTTPVVITLVFSSRAVTALHLAGDNALNEYPVDFVIKVYDANNVVLYTQTVTGNTVIDWNVPLSPILAVTKLEATITKINKANVVTKITEFYTAIKETYDIDMIQSMHVLEEVGYTTGGLPIGNVSANEADIVLSNVDRRFDLNNTKSTLYGFVKRNRRVKVLLGVYVGINIEWQSYGTYWTTSWDISRASLTASIVARDRLELLRLTNFNTSVIYTNQTLKQLFTVILADAGLKAPDYVLDASLDSIVIPYAWFPKQSHRDALQYLAQMGLMQVYCDKEGLINVNLDWDSTPTVMATYDDDVNVYESKYPLAVSEQVNYVEVTSKQWAIGATEQLYDANESITLAAGASLTKTYAFNQLPAYSLDTIVLTGGTLVTTTSGTLYAWGVDITFKNTDTVSHTITHVTLNGKLLKNIGSQVVVVQNQSFIKQDGLIKQSVNHDFIQDNTYAQNLANNILTAFGSSRYDVVLSNRGIIPIRLRDQVMVLDAHNNLKVPYMITRQSVDWNGSLNVTTEARKL